MDDNTPSIYDLEVRLAQIVRYFEEIEERLTEQSGFPVKLQQARTALEALVIIGEIVDADRERRGYWKHREPDACVIAFSKLVASFLAEHELSWEELAERLGLPSGTLSQLRWFAEDGDE